MGQSECTLLIRSAMAVSAISTMVDVAIDTGILRSAASAVGCSSSNVDAGER